MILAVDVDYRDNQAVVAGISFNTWHDATEQAVYTTIVNGVEAYQPGQFFRRELPCILQLLQEHSLNPDCIIIDGYVYLDGEHDPGLGKHLYDALGASVKVIGVAKRAFKDTPSYCEIYRGQSRKPLYVTAAGFELEQAKQRVTTMHGKFRIPDLIKKADRVCRA